MKGRAPLRPGPDGAGPSTNLSDFRPLVTPGMVCELLGKVGLMGTIVVICMVISVVVMLVGGVMMIVAAFRRGILWGLAYLLVPFAALVFLFNTGAKRKASLST